jgi:hypothetical protein
VLLSVPYRYRVQTRALQTLTCLRRTGESDRTITIHGHFQKIGHCILRNVTKSIFYNNHTLSYTSTMAPRSEFISNGWGVIEFKPRTGTWASEVAWTSSPLKTSSSFHDEASVQQQQRRVRFAPRSSVQTVEYIHVSDYSASEKASCWYNRPEYQAMRQHNGNTLFKIVQQIPLDPENECQFGLENQSPIENLRCHQVMHSARWAVLDEQEEQLRFDLCLQHDILAARYSSCTWEAHDRARFLGQVQSLWDNGGTIQL